MCTWFALGMQVGQLWVGSRGWGYAMNSLCMLEHAEWVWAGAAVLRMPWGGCRGDGRGAG